MDSMTGYGRGHAALGDLHITVEMRSVNHRYLDVRTRFAGPLSEFSAAAEEQVKARLGRGRVEITGKLDGNLRSAPELDMARARAAWAALLQLRDELCPGQEVPLTLLSTVPELFQLRESADPAALHRAVVQCTEDALTELQTMRAAEGRALHRDLAARADRIRELADSLGAQLPGMVEEYRTQLRARISALLPSGLSLDSGRLEHEVTLFADRADVAEELTRLASHCDQFAFMLESESGAVGRRLDFLLQEMGREVNTIGAKVANAQVTTSVVELKAELERMREQTQNVL